MNILWDFDGTIIDTYPAYTEVMAAVLGKAADKQEIYDKLKVSYGYAVEYFNIDIKNQEKLKSMRAQLNPEDMKPFDQIVAVLKFADKNVIMTHKHKQGVRHILEHHKLDHYFDEIVTIEDGFPRKPDASAYAYLHNKYSLDLVIGDRELDLLPGRQLGIRTCMFGGKSNAADYMLEHYREFFNLPIIEQMNLRR